jgi:hypothetical protein
MLHSDTQLLHDARLVVFVCHRVQAPVLKCAECTCTRVCPSLPRQASLTMGAREGEAAASGVAPLPLVRPPLSPLSEPLLPPSAPLEPSVAAAPAGTVA